MGVKHSTIPMLDFGDAQRENLCHHFCGESPAVLIPGLYAMDATWNLTRAYEEIARHWPEFDRMTRATVPPLSPTGSRFLLAVHEAPEPWSVVSFPELNSNEAAIGRARLQAWVVAVKKEPATRPL
jgi:hypothetical protein